MLFYVPEPRIILIEGLEMHIVVALKFVCDSHIGTPALPIPINGA